jgi:hypothetical protein
VLAARHAERVVAVDREPRALAFGRRNAAMNGVAEEVTWLRGDLYDPVPPDERFDLILANPPFVPSPDAGAGRVAFRDAGERGEDVLARLLAGVPARLGRDGTAAVVSVFAEAEDEPFRARLEAWLPRGTDFGALLVRLGSDEPAEYALSQTRRAFDDGFEELLARHARWLGSIRRAKIRRLSGGVLALRARSGPTPPWFKAIDAPWPQRPLGGDELERAFGACETAHAIVFADELLDRPARTPADLVLTDELERVGAAPAAPAPEPETPAGSEDRAEEAAGAEGAEEEPKAAAEEPEEGGGEGAGEGASETGGEGEGEGAAAEAGAGELRARRHRARAPSALGGEVGISGELRRILERCDGRTTLRAAVEELARAQRTDARELGERLFPDLFELVARGLIRV